ncbi:hypothetical protein NIE32_13625 [Sporolactobacillus kofuensis]|nr:hypothetical protein [Sporolactobacillus kofuensis]MCO7177143.1 hypothetical protein [Sporolactobacillus kofuensis]
MLFRGTRKKWAISLISLIATAFMRLFLGWAILYPIIIVLFVLSGKLVKRTFKNQTFDAR